MRQKAVQIKADDELRHYGVKGMKWGVRRTSEQLGHKRVAKVIKRSTIIKNAITSGEISLKINRDKQLRHTKSYHKKGRSYLNGNLEYAQKLVDELHGTGDALLVNGNWSHKERVKADYFAGIHIDEYGWEEPVDTLMIVYSKTGTHIYPRKDRTK